MVCPAKTCAGKLRSLALRTRLYMLKQIATYFNLYILTCHLIGNIVPGIYTNNFREFFILNYFFGEFNGF